jgi:hypothetical protein
MAVDLKQSWIDDVREPVMGDSYTWYALEPTAAKKSLVIHHSGVHSRNHEDAFSVARYHVINNGWGGIGYHFVITHDSHPNGARIQYAGDLGTWRAHVASDNPGRVGISLMGDFTQEKPGENQLRLARQLIDFLMAPNGILPSINYPSQIIGHGQIAGQATACPGWQAPWFNDWMNYLKGGSFPAHFYAAPAPAPVTPPAPPAPVEVVPTPEPVTPEWEQTWKPLREDKQILRDGAYAVDITTGKVLTQIPRNEIVKVGGYFWQGGKEYMRTVWATEAGKWNGIPIEFSETDAVPVPVIVVPGSGAPTPPPLPPSESAPNPLLEGDEFADLANAPDPRIDWWQVWVEAKEMIAVLLSPILKALGKKG